MQGSLLHIGFGEADSEEALLAGLGGSVEASQADFVEASRAGHEMTSRAGHEAAFQAGFEVASQAGREAASQAGFEEASQADLVAASQVSLEEASPWGLWVLMVFVQYLVHYIHSEQAWVVLEQVPGVH